MKKVIVLCGYNTQDKFSLNILLNKEFDLINVNNEVELFKIIKSTKVDLIISDFNNENAATLTTIKSIKQDINLPYIPILVVSTLSSLENKITAIEAGASYFISIPFLAEFLRKKIYELIS